MSQTPSPRAPHYAAILCIGTELTTGQITNRNAAHLSQWLTDLGANVLLHETVPDDRPLIHEALDRCSRTASLIFVTGGLGPTTDDFTRDVVAEWAGRKLQYDQASFDSIQERLSKVGIASAPSQKQQCFYPEGSRILQNSEGTAHGFSLENRGVKVWVLPGPPREIEAVWRGNEIGAEILKLLPGARPRKLLTWQCLGRGEADVGELTEKALAGSGLQTGYRVHRPFVEVKVWCDEERFGQALPYIEKLEETLATWIVARGETDLAHELLRELGRFDEVEIVDGATGGMLPRRLGDLLSANAGTPERSNTEIHVISDWSHPALPESWIEQALTGDTALTLAIAGFSVSGQWSIGMRQGTKTRQETLTLPYRPSLPTERNRSYVTEYAFKLWTDWLRTSVN